MNIPVLTHSGRVVVRPDTTWKKEIEDFCPPDFVDSVSFSPVLFTRIVKPGRSISRRFAARYFDGVGFGLLLYPDTLMDGSEEGYACASCLDRTTFLPLPVSENSILGDTGCKYTLFRDVEQMYSCTPCSAARFEEAVEAVSKYVYLRTGDLLAMELQGRAPLWKRGDGAVRVRTTCNEETMLDFKIF